MHSLKDWNLFEALQPDPTRTNALQWIMSYDTIFNAPSVPLFDLKNAASRAVTRECFSVGTRAIFPPIPTSPILTPSCAPIRRSAHGRRTGLISISKLLLPTHKYRRLHLNLPDSPEGAFFDQSVILAAVV